MLGFFQLGYASGLSHFAKSDLIIQILIIGLLNVVAFHQGYQ